MTIARMQQLGRLQITKQESRLLVKQLSDSNGLTPSESADYRYALEQRPNWVEQFDDAALVTHCARCHTGDTRRTSLPFQSKAHTKGRNS